MGLIEKVLDEIFDKPTNDYALDLVTHGASSKELKRLAEIVYIEA